MSTATQSIRESRNSLELELRKRDKRIKGSSCQCPVHDDEHPSASIYRGADGAWRIKCHSCGFCGDVFDLRAKLEGRDLGDVLREASGHGQQSNEPAPTPKRIFGSVEEIVRSVGNLGKVEDHYEYTNPDTGEVETVQVRYIDPDSGKKKFLVHHAALGGFVLGAPPKPWPVYNRTRIRSSNTIIVVEGEQCVQSLHKVGIVATTSLSGSLNADKADWSPLAGKKVYIWPDADEPGSKYAQAVIAKLDEVTPRPEVYLLNVDGLSQGEGWDVADFLTAGGTAEEVWCLLNDGSEPVGASSELLARIEDMTAGKWRSIDWPGCPALSMAAKALFPGAIAVVVGDPGATKSMFVTHCMCRWHLLGVPVALFALEEDRAFHMMRLLAIQAGSWDVLDDDLARKNPEALRAVYAEHRATLDSFSPSLHTAPVGQLGYPQLLQWIETRCKAGDKILAIDPITAVYTGESRHIDDLSFIVKASAILRDYEARMILVTHPRMGTAKRNGGGTQDDLAGGRAFSRHTQTVLWLNRHDPAKRFNCATAMGTLPIVCNRSILIAKARNGPGHGWKIGFNLGSDVRFAEKGIIVADAGAEVLP